MKKVVRDITNMKQVRRRADLPWSEGIVYDAKEQADRKVCRSGRYGSCIEKMEQESPHWTVYEKLESSYYSNLYII